MLVNSDNLSITHRTPTKYPRDNFKANKEGVIVVACFVSDTNGAIVALMKMKRRNWRL